MCRASLWSVILVALSLGMHGAAQAADGTSSCQGIAPDQEISFQGQTLRETPDINEPALRRVNALLTARCFEQVRMELQAWQDAHPADHQVVFLQARLLWIFGEEEAAAKIIDAVLEQHPDFASARVLASGLALESDNVEKASAMIDAAERLSPTDLWLFIDRLRLKARTAESGDSSILGQITEVMRDPQFPKGVRAAAADLIVEWFSGVADDRVIEHAYQASIKFGLTDNRTDATFSLASWLIKKQHRTAEARALLEPMLSMQPHCCERINLLIAESWLFDAARIDSVQTSRNFDLVEKARDALGGTLDPLVREAALSPSLAPLQGFFRIVDNVDAPDEDGMSGLCASLQAMILDVSVVEEILENLADPNQACGDTTPLGLLLIHGRAETEKRLLLLKDLLARGADPNPLVFTTQAKVFCKQDGRCDGFLSALQPAWDAAEAHGK